MRLFEYLDIEKLARYIQEGLVDVRYHKYLPLRILTFSKEVVFNNQWDDVTTKCRGLIVGPNDVIISRPFEKFFNLNTSYRPETLTHNLPTSIPFVFEKLDGSLGILYEFEGKSGIATKGSFNSDQAAWATQWYHKNCPNPQWPEGYTPIFEIIAESVQHHVVDYGGQERLILLALINNETGEEVPFNNIYHWAKINGLETAEVYAKSLHEVVAEDRENHEGYVLSWPIAGQPPFKVKVKHESFLALQKIVHAATPKSILEALTEGNAELLDKWMYQLNEPLGFWVRDWVSQLQERYGRILYTSTRLFNTAQFESVLIGGGRKTFANYVLRLNKDVAPVCFAMLDGKDYSKIIWKIVESDFHAQLDQPFALESSQGVCIDI